VSNMENTELLAYLEKLDEDSVWFNEKYGCLRTYQGRVVAIKNKQIIAVRDNVEELLKELEKMKEDPAFLLIEAVPPENIAFIL